MNKAAKIYKFRTKKCDFKIEIERRQNFYFIGFEMHAGPNGIISPISERQGKYKSFKKAIDAACDICLEFFRDKHYTGIGNGETVNVPKDIFDEIYKIKYQPKDLFDEISDM